MDLHILRKRQAAPSRNVIVRMQPRKGLASIEVVMATATIFTAATLLAGAGVRACLNLYHTIANLVGWPFL